MVNVTHHSNAHTRSVAVASHTATLAADRP
jgi:hypothetical protein